MSRQYFSHQWHRWTRFWFKPVTASGFGLMRIGFGLCALTVYVLQMPYVWYYYTNAGIFPARLAPLFLRHEFRFSLLDTIQTPMGVSMLYAVLVAALVLVTIGLFTRVALLVVTVILFSFHESSLIMLDGSDTMLRLLCFLLLLAPSGRSFSLDSALDRLDSWRRSGHDIPHTMRQMPIWPYRLLLWQIICLYVSAGLDKMRGDMWWGGSSVQTVLLHTWFTNVPASFVHTYIDPIGPIITIFTFLMQVLWLGMLILPALRMALPRKVQSFIPVDAFKRALLICGLLLHGGIAIFMTVGVFSYVMMTAYVGLLLDGDFDWIRSLFNSQRSRRIYILYDSHCRLCRTSMALVSMLDWLHHIHIVDFHDPKARKALAPTTSLAALAHSMHAKLANGKIVAGFFAFRALTWNLPLLWPMLPILYLPGVTPIGKKIYAKIAANRLQCRDGKCRV